MRLLRELTVFTPLSQPALEQLAAHLETVEVSAGTAVVREGDPGDRFYIVEEGALAVTVRGAARTPIHAGGFFGEIALLRETARTATVTATTDCRLWHHSEQRAEKNCWPEWGRNCLLNGTGRGS